MTLPYTPLVIVEQPPTKIAEMTDAERRAFANELFAKMAKARKPAQ